MPIDFYEFIRQLHLLPYFKRRMEIARNIKPSISRFIYKYKGIDEEDAISVDRLRDILVKSRLWLSAPSDFNDPFDLSARIVVDATGIQIRERFDDLLKRNGMKFKERREKLREIVHAPRKQLEKQLTDIFDKHKNNVGVFSFAGDPRNILMWSHYAKQHSGVCIQFERARDFALLSGALSVKYSDEYPVVNWIVDFEQQLGNVLLQKSKGWAYEKEHRIVRPDYAHTYINFDSEAIRSIILGCRITKGSQEKINQLIKEREDAGLSPVNIYKSYQHNSKYKLKIAKLN